MTSRAARRVVGIGVLVSGLAGGSSLRAQSSAGPDAATFDSMELARLIRACRGERPADDQPMSEYACHEGDGMSGILGGSRARELIGDTGR